MLIPSRLPLTLPPTSHSCVQLLNHTVRIHSKFLPLATQHSRCTYCVPAGPGQLRRTTVQMGSQLYFSLPHLDDKDDGTGGSQG